MDSDGFAGMAETSPQAGATAMAALYVLKDILTVPAGETPSVDRLVIASMIERFIADNLTNNVVEVIQPGQSEAFVKNADGITYTPPQGSTAVLSTSGSNVTYRTKEGTLLSFSQSGPISQWSNPAGIVVNFTYDGSGTLTTVANTVGGQASRQITLAYTGGLISSVSTNGPTQGSTATTTYSYTGNELTGVTDPLNRTTTFAYDTASRLTHIAYPSHPNNAFVTNSYDSLGRIMQQADANGHVTNVFVAGTRTELNDGIAQISYFDAQGHQTAGVDGLGNVTTITYDGAGNVLSRTLPEGNSVSYTYDGAGNVLTETRRPKPGSPLAPRSRSFTYATVAGGQVKAGGVALNRLLTATDFAGNVTTYGYGDGAGNLTSVLQPAVSRNGSSVQPSTTYGYSSGLKTSETDPEGRLTQYDYYSSFYFEPSVTVVDAGRLGLTTQYGPDYAGNVTAVWNPNRHQSGYSYDAARQLTVFTPPPYNGVGGSTYSYDADGRPTIVQRGTGDPNFPQQQTTTTYSPTGKVLTVTDASNSVVTRTYNGYDDPLSLLDGAGRTFNYVYDKDHRLIQATKFGGQQEARTYSANGLLVRQEDAKHNRTTYVLDGFDRVSQVVHADGSAERFAYNADGDVVSQTTRAGQLTTYAYDALHRRISRTSQASGVTTTYGYDLVGRLLSVATPAVAGNLASGTWTFSFDTAGRPTGETGPDGKHVGFAWDAAGNRIGLTFPDGVVATASYTQLEQLNQVKLGNIVAWTDTYDGLGRLGARVTGNGYTSNFLHNSPGELDLSDVQNHLANGPTNNGVYYSYAYNGAHQVTSTNRQSYNAAVLAHPSASGSVGYGAADGLNRLPGVTAGPAYAYDANGNQTSDGTRTVTYDPEGLGHVVQVDTASGRSTYLYDPLGRRYSKTTGGLTTVYLHDQAGREVAEYDGSGTLLRRLLYDPAEVAPIAVVPASGTTLYHHPDRLGTPTIVSGDGSTLDVAENEYLANGEGVPSGTSFGLAGYRYDPESRLYHVGARDYDPRQGRFVQPDPIGTQGGLNLYAYVGNDPLNLTDPSGLCTSSASGCASALYGLLGTVARGIGDNGGPALESAAGGAGVSVAGVALGAVAGVLVPNTSIQSGADEQLLVQAATGETNATVYGRLVHQTYNPGDNYVLNSRIPGSQSLLRPDAVDYDAQVVRELKPDNSRAISLGQQQLQTYINALNKATGGNFTGQLDVYNPAGVIRTVP